MKTITIIIVIILSTTIVSAMYPGECNSIEFPNTDDVYWNVEGNSSDMTGFSYTKDGINITYCFHLLYKPDSFTLTFYNYQERTVSSSRNSKGGSCSYNPNFDWECGDWSSCSNGKQTRDCKEWNNCHNTYGRPNITQSCIDVLEVDDSRLIEEPEPIKLSEPIEEEIIESNALWIYLIVGLWIVIILVVAIVLIRLRRKNET